MKGTDMNDKNFIFAFSDTAYTFLERAVQAGFADLNNTKPRRQRGAWTIRVPYAVYSEHSEELRAIAEDLL
jgi:hypothetical protein